MQLLRKLLRLGLGGAIYLGAGSSLTSDGDSFQDNGSSTSYGYGGAVYATASTVVETSGLDVRDNSATYGGGFYLRGGGSFSDDGSTFDGNAASHGTGGLILYDEVAGSLRGTVFTSNSGSGSGAIYAAYSSTLSADGLSFQDNSSTSGSGGAIYLT